MVYRNKQLDCICTLAVGVKILAANLLRKNRKKCYNVSATFSVLIRLISERAENRTFRKGVNQWTTVQVATAVSLMVMTKG